MAKREIKKGATNQTIDIFIQDSSSTTGAGLTGLAFGSSGLVCFFREGATATATALTLVTQTVGGVHTDGGFIEISSANMPGMYRLDLSDTIVSGTNPYVTMMLKGATNMSPLPIELQLVDYDPFDAVRLGLTALPNAAADAAGGLPISDAGGLDLDTQLAATNEVTAVRMAALTDWINGGRLDLLLDAIPTTVMRGTDNVDTATMRGTDGVDTATMRGTNDALLASSAPTNFSSMVISGAGAVDSLLQGFLNTLITETSAGRITNNFDFFYDNSDAQTGQVVDDVGGGGGGGTDWTASERNEIRGRLGVTGTTTAGGNTPTLSTQASVDAVPTAVQNRQEMDSNSTQLAKLGTPAAASISADNANIQTAVDAIPTTVMRGTDNVDTATMRGTDGVDTATMRGTDGAPTAVQNRQEMDSNSTKLATIDNSSIKKNVAFPNFPFLMVLASDHVTPATGLTVTGQRKLDNGSFVNVNGVIREISNGIYEFDALSADTNGTTGIWRFSSATADDAFVTFNTAL